MNDVITPEMLTTVGGAAIATSLIFEVVKRAVQPTDEVLARFGAIIAIIIGILIVVPATLVFGPPLDQQVVFTAIYTGIIGGLAASGIYSFSKGVANTLTSDKG